MILKIPIFQYCSFLPQAFLKDYYSWKIILIYAQCLNEMHQNITLCRAIHLHVAYAKLGLAIAHPNLAVKFIIWYAHEIAKLEPFAVGGEKSFIFSQLLGHDG